MKVLVDFIVVIGTRNRGKVLANGRSVNRGKILANGKSVKM